MDIEKQNQADLKNWEGSAVTLMGESETKRPFFLKAVTRALVAVLAFQATAALAAIPMIGHKTPGVKRGVTYTQAYELPGYEHSELGKVVQSMDKDGKSINEYFGTNNTVFVWSNDTQLKEVLDATNPNFIHDYAPETVGAQMQVLFEHATKDFSNHFEVARKAAHDGIRSSTDGDMLRPLNAVYEKGDRISRQNSDVMYVIKADVSEQKNLEERDHSYPRFASKEERTSQQFFNAVSRGVNQVASFDTPVTSTFHTSTVAGADVAYALIALKQTGNLDAWNLNLKAQRMTSVDDPLHMTSEWVDAALDGITHDTVKNMSDKEIILFSTERIMALEKVYNTENRSHMFDKAHEISNTHVLYSAKYQDVTALEKVAKYESRFDSYYAGTKTFDSATLVKNYSLKAMEASLNNMAYQGKLGALEGEFVKAVHNHATQFNDPGAVTALNDSMKGGHVDFQKFATKMDMKVDFDSHTRLEHNTSAMTKHLNEIVPSSVEKNTFSLSSIESGASSTTHDYFARKMEEGRGMDKRAESPSFNV
ncbi:hypothetical protein RYA05_03670 [Pseudomonas syringae pv. actinidiae]|nr:hypothetical protein [Pseudomonas syringae pv. actinidiae]